MLPWQTPAILLAFLTWLQSPPATFAEAARRETLRRQVVPKAVRTLSNADVDRVPRDMLPRAPPSEAASAHAASAAAAAAKQPVTTPEAHDENWWRARAAHARDALDRDDDNGARMTSEGGATSADYEQGREDERRFERSRITDDVRDSERQR